MTREEIQNAWEAWPAGRTLEIVDFAVEIVRRHNEECVMLALDYVDDGELEPVKDLVRKLREAKP